MLANNQFTYITGHSPFKFLKPYERKDQDIFYGRKANVKHLKFAFNKYSSVILYGPSGSGKSSLINCGLLKGKDPSGIFEIRRGNYILDTLEKQLFSKYATSIDFIPLIREIKTIQSKRRIAKKALRKSNEALIQIETNFQQGKLKEEEAAQKSKKWLENIKKKEIAIPNLERELVEKNKLFSQGFTTILKNLKTTPYLIFDQFEEIFISGSLEEINEFGTFLSCISKNKIPVKILLSIREEYFSKLNKFEKFLPQILLRKVELDNPKIDSVREILEKSFESFNINQVTGENETALSEQEKEKRINLIIKQLSYEETELQCTTLHEEHYHLPFLQIYLDRLYREDSYRTYGKIDFPKDNFPPIEFEEKEIQDFGNMNKVLKDYIQEINRVLFLKNSKVLSDIHPSINLVVKFLKLFITTNNTKKGIALDKIENTDSSNPLYCLKDAKLNEKIQLGIWNEYDDKQYKQVISNFITDLRNFRLIKINDGFAELGHDILAQVISKYPEERSIKEILQIRFQTFFEEYQTKNKEERYYLNETQIAACDNDKLLPYILQDEDPIVHKKKKQYWDLSKQSAEAKWAAEVRKKEREIKKLRTKNYSIFCLLLLSLVGALFLGKQSFELKNQGSQIQQQRQESRITGRAFEGTAIAYNHITSDRTQAIIKIHNSEQEFTDSLSFAIRLQQALRSEDSWYNKVVNWMNLEGHDYNAEKPTLINNFLKNLYKDFYRFPFYSQNLKLSKQHKSPIIDTKFLPIFNKPDSIQVYFLTKAGTLFKTSINYSATKGNIPYSEVAKNVRAFALYYNKDLAVTPIYISNNRLFSKQASEPVLLDSLNGYYGNPLLERVYDSLFIATSSDTIREINRLSNGIKINNRTALINNTFSAIAAYQSSYLVFTERGNAYQPKKIGFKKVIKNANKGLKAVIPTQTDHVFLSTNDGFIFNKNLTDQSLIKHHHEDGITSIDYCHFNNNELLLIGSDDRTASVLSWSSKKREGVEKKRLIGHSDKITDSYFLDTLHRNFVLTASADGTIKVWNLSPVEQKTYQVKEADLITRIKQNPKDSLLYVGFLFKKQPKGYLYAMDQNLEGGFLQKKYQRKLQADSLGQLSSFDFTKEGRLMIGGFNNLLVSISDTIPDAKGAKLRIAKTPPFPIINEVAVKDSTLLIATKKGLFLIRDYFAVKKDIVSTLDNIKINSIDIHPTKDIALAAASNGTIYLWNLRSLAMEKIDAHLDEVRDAEFSKTGTYFISGSHDNTAIIWKFDEEENSYKKFGSTLNVHSNNIEDVEFYQDRLVLTASTDQTVQIFELNEAGTNFQQVPSLIKQETKITAATFSLDGQYIYTGSKNGLIKKWAFREFKDIVADRIPQ